MRSQPHVFKQLSASFGLAPVFDTNSATSCVSITRRRYCCLRCRRPGCLEVDWLSLGVRPRKGLDGPVQGRRSPQMLMIPRLIDLVRVVSVTEKNGNLLKSCSMLRFKCHHINVTSIVINEPISSRNFVLFGNIFLILSTKKVSSEPTSQS